jgi:hypothetical protein
VITVQMNGQRELAQLAKRLKAAGDKGIRRELTKAFNEATEPAKDEVRASALDVLPRAGGLAERVASARVSTRTRLTGSSPSVKLTQRIKGYDLKVIDKGWVRHPVHGHRGSWVNQQVPEGYWRKPMRLTAARTEREVILAMRRVSRMIARG